MLFKLPFFQVLTKNLGATKALRTSKIKHANGFESILQCISLLNNEMLRDLMIEAAKEINPTLDIDLLRQLVTRINRIMLTKDFSYTEAKAWSQTEDIHCWLMQGIQLAKKDIPLEVFIYISSFLLNLTDKKTFDFYDEYHNAVVLKLYENSVTKLNSLFFGKPQKIGLLQYKEELENAAERYEARSPQYWR